MNIIIVCVLIVEGWIGLECGECFILVFLECANGQTLDSIIAP
jgi:hypothetical protein